jgi:hypothetical protein
MSAEIYVFGKDTERAHPIDGNQPNYERFKFFSEIDWIELRVIFASATNFQMVRRNLPRLWRDSAFLVADGGGLQRSETVFTFRIHDPHSVEAVELDIEILRERLPFSAEPEITAIEITFDAYFRTGSDHALVGMVAHLSRCHAVPPSDNRRTLDLIGKDLKAQATADKRFVLISLKHGYPVYCGNRGDSYTTRAYVKRSDKSGKIDLPPMQHRARFEVTLSGEDMPFTTLDGWRTFNFESLAKLFRFRRWETGGMCSFRKMLLESPYAPALGKPEDPKLRAGKKRQTKKSTAADSTLQEAAYAALRKLTREQRQAADKVRKPRMQVSVKSSTANQDVGNSVRICTVDR